MTIIYQLFNSFVDETAAKMYNNSKLSKPQRPEVNNLHASIVFSPGFSN